MVLPVGRIFAWLVVVLCSLLVLPEWNYAAINFFALPISQQQDENALSADSYPIQGVPKGSVEGPFVFHSQIFPGTVRNYWVYVPATYHPEKRQCLLVVQDGIGRANDWRLQTVMDNLIHKGEMPSTIGLFVDHGIVPAANEEAQPRFNRSFEYDAMGDRYAKFLIDELLPQVAKKYNISADPNDRAIAGASSGGICAFNVAWERPDQFRRVSSTIGTFVGLRGGNEFPTLVRKTEVKPIRVFLQDGSDDLDIYAGGWWTANQSMLAALHWAGYDVKHVWGTGGHNGKQGAAVMPDAMRWLWRAYEKPLVVDPDHGAGRRVDLLLPNQSWQAVGDGYQAVEGLTLGWDSHLFFADAGTGRIYKRVDGQKPIVFANLDQVSNLAFGADQKLYATCPAGIVRYDVNGNQEPIAAASNPNHLLMLANGSGYWAAGNQKKLFGLSSDGTFATVDQGIDFPAGLAVSADQTLLWVGDREGKFVYSFQISATGGLQYKQEYGDLHTPHATSHSGAAGMAMDTDGRLYVATTLGVQVLDPLGRVNLIIANPPGQRVLDICFGGPQGHILYAASGKQIYQRTLTSSGCHSWQTPVKPPKPGL